MKIYYWAPFLSKIATISAVIKSIKSIQIYSKKKIDISIIDSVGEWNDIKEKTEGINLIKLYNKPFSNKLFRGGFIKSRISQLFIFFFSFKKLLILLKSQKPDFIIAHLIISLPLLINMFLSNETKLIIRISGLPKLNFFRRIYWKLFSRKVFKVTCPTIATYEKLKKMNIFSKEKLEILFDPVINVKEIVKKKKEKIEDIFYKKKYIIGVGRLTKQKNFSLLVNAFYKINIDNPEYNLVILGDGEERENLELLIKKFHLEDKVFLIGFKENAYKYIRSAKCFILSSRWEDPGFVLLEASFLNIPIIASNCKNGPSEILNQGEGGFLFTNESEEDLINKFKDFENSTESEIKKQLIKSKINSKKYTQFNHYIKLKKILCI